MVFKNLLFFSNFSASTSLLLRCRRTTSKGLPILPDVFAGTFVGLASDKLSPYDVLQLEVCQAKRQILLGSCFMCL